VSDRTYLNDISRNMLLSCVSSGAVLEAGGSSLAKAVKVNVFLANMDDFAAVNEVYAKFFPDPKPVSINTHFETGNV
jgi:enamine deaminase RidA (YjgF/YER057c/UK114 family)